MLICEKYKMYNYYSVLNSRTSYLTIDIFPKTPFPYRKRMSFINVSILDLNLWNIYLIYVTQLLLLPQTNVAFIRSLGELYYSEVSLLQRMYGLLIDIKHGYNILFLFECSGFLCLLDSYYLVFIFFLIFTPKTFDMLYFNYSDILDKNLW